MGVVRGLCVARVSGLVPYADGLALQLALADAVREARGGLGDVLVLLQHAPTYSLGRRLSGLSGGAPGPDLRGQDARALAAATGADVTVSSRGGRATYHGPGQVVAYPIVSLRGLRLMPRAWVEGLEACTADALNATFFRPSPKPHLEARPGVGPDRTGVWVGDAKVAALGVQVTGGVSVHGVAVNVDVDLGRFAPIVPCGIDDAEVTSVARLLDARGGREREGGTELVAQAEDALARGFPDHFGHTVVGRVDVPAGALRDAAGVRDVVRAICRSNVA